MFTVSTKQVATQTVLSVQKSVYIGELGKFISDSWHLLREEARKGGGSAGTFFCIYHGEVNENANGPVEACLPVPANFQASHNFSLHTIPAANVVYTIVPRRLSEFPAILGAYDAVHSWIETSGHQHAAAPWEIYLQDYDTAAPDEPTLEVAWPYK